MPPLRSTGAVPEAEHPQYAGQYRLQHCLGSGGMGVVHLATTGSGRRLAVKTVHAEHAAVAEFRARFRQEVAAARRVSGAFTASVVDADPDAERPWMATLFIDGPTLSERVKRNGPLGVAELLLLGSGLAEALRDIHRAGVVHRDLKPSNVLLAADGPKVIDFGISRPAEADGELRTETGKLIGTPPFMAPEQFQRPREVGPAADVFALGAVLVHAATGRGPFDSDSPYVVAYQVVHNEPELTGVPVELAPVLRRCLEKEPGLRPSPGELLDAFRVVGAGGEVPARPPRDEDGSTGDGPPDSRTMALGARTARRPVDTDSSTDPSTGTPVAAPQTEAPKRRGGRARAVTALAALAALAVAAAAGVVAFASYDRDDGDGGDGKRPGTVAVRSAGQTVRPWVTTLGAGGGETRAPLCTAADRALYCAAPGVRAARLGAADGRIAWSVPSETAEPQTAPVLAGGLVRVAEPGTGRLAALDPKDGTEVWHADASAYPKVVHTDAVVLLAAPDGRVRALDGRTGEERWSKRLPVGEAQWAAEPGGGVYAAVAAPDGRSTRVYAVGAADGSVDWSVRLAGNLALAQASGSAVLLLSTDTEQFTDAVVRLDTGTHRARRVELTAPVDQAQAVPAGGAAYVIGSGGSLVAVTWEGDGGERWRLQTGVSRASRPLVAGGRVYLTASDGRLLAVDAGRGVLLGATGARMDGGRGTFNALLPAPATGPGAVYATAPDGSVFAQSDQDPARW
ncbi:serine/threonine-protein kinase [Streptomyces sp. NPDC047097]|uniref:serine/threonine-protein kinase n=1 Tax=Streptomyces sp. NPDC047097 TaxID=3155260 RepID=UPI0033EEE6BB